MEFYVSSENADSSFIMPPKYTQKKIMPVLRLDSILNENSKIKLVKLEAEGAEPEVLQGFGKLLNKVEYITADLGFERGENLETTFFAVTNFLLENNFELMEVSFKRLVALYRNKNFSVQ